jgi:hypothetical protein
MQHQRHSRPRRMPPPDVVRYPLPPATTQSSPPPPPAPAFLIIGLFALRLAKRLIEGLDHYPEHNADSAWLTSFLAPYASEFALAKISGPRREDYVATYQKIVSRMKSQPRYPFRFMQMNPLESMQPRQCLHEAPRDDAREMSDRGSSVQSFIHRC